MTNIMIQNKKESVRFTGIIAGKWKSNLHGNDNISCFLIRKHLLTIIYP